jgi:ribonuclease HII
MAATMFCMITVGIDEVGRGCWAGPLVAGAVILGEPIVGLKDSKKLSKKQREKLVGQIKSTAVSIGLGWVWPEEIDIGGVTQAVKVAMERALAAIDASYGEIIIDGNINYFPNEPKAQAVIKADDSVPAVSAASIVAKVARDDYMAEMAKKYPEYAFEKHVGYGTAAHIAALKLHGICVLHRKSYKPIKVIIASSM